MNNTHILIITNIPSFYKIKLFNSLQKKCNIFVLFEGVAEKNIIRNEDFFDEKPIFPFRILSGNFIQKSIKVIKYIHALKNSRLIYDGWNSIFFFISLLIHKKIELIVESSIRESKTFGLKSLIKRIVLKKVYCIYVPGESNKKLILALGYTGIIKKTYGVGLYNRVETPHYYPKNVVKNFLFVGRLSSEKNIDLLINIFNQLPNKQLSIIGFGPQEHFLKSIVTGNNITFFGAVNNREMPKYYQQHDVFVLPSLSETWGLVIEEALNNGLPILASKNVGCAEEIIIPDKNGLLFSSKNEKELLDCVNKISDPSIYNTMVKYILSTDFQAIEDKQIGAYLC